MSELLEHVEQGIRTRQLFRPGQRILVAVSGGADSMVLLKVLHELAPRHGWRLTVAHLNHQLRGRSSAADERLVRRAAQELKLAAVVERAEVRQLARAQKLSIEMAARELRHGFLARVARRGRIPSIALAHHADDQLELFFLRLLRGSGGEGLAGMKWRNASPSDPDIQVVHPLLDQPKVELVEYAAKEGIRYREDASNALLDFQRNRIRHELLPLLRSKYQPALDKTIPRVMEIVGAEAEFAGEAAREWMRGRGSLKSKVQSPKSGGAGASHVAAGILPAVEGGILPPGPALERSRTAIPPGRMPGSTAGRMPAATRKSGGGDRRRGEAAGPGGGEFEELPVAVQRRCVQLQLVAQGVVADFELVEQLRLRAERPVSVGRGAQVKGDGPGTGETPVLLYAVRDQAGLVRLQGKVTEEFKTGSAAVDLEGRAGEVEFDGARVWWRIRSRSAVQQTKAGAGRECFDADKVGSHVYLRHWRPGDRFQPIGMAGPVKLQDFFTNQKVPRGRRRQLMVAATAKGELFWVEGMRISERFKLTKETIRCLQWRWKRP